MIRRTIKGLEIVEFDSTRTEQTLEFLGRLNPTHPELADRQIFEWQQCRRYLALFKDAIVGHIAQITQNFQIHGSSQQLGWAATLSLDTSNPLIQTFAGTALLDRISEKSDVIFGAVGVVPEIERTHARRGFTVRRDMAAMYARFLNTEKSLRFVGKSPMFGPAIKVFNGLLGGATVKASDIHSVSRFDPSWDTIWSGYCGRRYDIFGERTASFLNYKTAQPHKEYRRFVHSGPDGQPDGYLVVREAESKAKGIRILRVCDVLGSESAVIQLLAHARVFGQKAEVDAIVAIGSCVDARLYRRAGLWVSKPYPVVVPPSVEGTFNLTFFDSDLDNLW